MFCFQGSYPDENGTPWATEKVYKDHVKKHSGQHGKGDSGKANYLAEVEDAYQAVIQQQESFESAGRDATIQYVGEQNNKYEYTIKIENKSGKKRVLILTGDNDWSVVTYHKNN